MPLSTSPDPAVASDGGAFVLMIAVPSGAAMTVSLPLRTTTALLRRAAARARESLSPRKSNSRLNSPSCGVSTHRAGYLLDQVSTDRP